MESILHFDVQERGQLIGEVSARGTMHAFLGGGQQRAETGKPGFSVRPQSAIIKAGNFAQGVVSAAMRIAGQVIQRLEFAEYGDIDRGAEDLFELVQRSDLVAQQKPAQSIGAEGEGVA